MKSVLAAFVLGFISSAAAYANCAGEAHITASVLRVEKTGVSHCKAYIDPITISSLTQNPRCPLNLENFKQNGFDAGIVDGHDCALQSGDRINGHIIQNWGPHFSYLASNQSYELNLDGKFVSSAATQAFTFEFNKQCKSLLYTIKKLKLISANSQYQKIDQGYVDMIWTLVFEIEYKNYVQQKADTVKVQITEGLEDRDGTLETYVDLFSTHYGSDNDAICNQ